MKSRMFRLIIIAIALLFAQSAWAFYNPSTGRWLSRDPIAEEGGANIYGFVAGDPILHTDTLGKQFDDQGEVTLFSLGMGNKAQTRTRIVDFRAACTCIKGLMCKMEFIAFRMVSKTEIGLYAVSSMSAPPPYKPYTREEVTRNSVHEAKHRHNDKGWHDSNLGGIMSDLSQRTACAGCEQRIESIKQQWRDKWTQFSRVESQHIGPAWTDADRTPTPPDLNPDQNTWLWEIPVESLYSPYP